MAHGSKKRSSIEPVAYLMFPADTVYLLKDGELLQLTSPQLPLFVLFQILILHFF